MFAPLRHAARVRLIDLLASVNLEGEVLDADVVVAVGATVGWTQAETTITDCSVARGRRPPPCLCRSDT